MFCKQSKTAHGDATAICPFTKQPLKLPQKPETYCGKPSTVPITRLQKLAKRGFYTFVEFDKGGAIYRLSEGTQTVNSALYTLYHPFEKMAGVFRMPFWSKKISKFVCYSPVETLRMEQVAEFKLKLNPPPPPAKKPVMPTDVWGYSLPFKVDR